MEQIDPIQARQVWGRVRGNPLPEDPLPRLLELEQETGLLYAQLARFPLLSGNRTLARLREECSRFERLYTGMMALSDAGRPAPGPRHTLRGNPAGFLRQCWTLRRQSLELLEQGRFAPTLSPVPDCVRERLRNHCLLLLELTGWVSSRE